MKQSILFFFVLLIGQNLSAQTSYYELKLRSQATNRLVSGRNVDLYQSAVKIYDLSESSTTPGVYFHNAVAHGQYDIFVNDLEFKTGVWVGASKVSTVVDNFDNTGYLQGAAVLALADSMSAKGIKFGHSIDQATIDTVGVGALHVKNASITSVHLADNGVSIAKFKGALLEDETFSVSDDSLVIDLTLYGLTNPKAFITNKSGWQGYVSSLSTAQVVVKPYFVGQGDNVTFDLLILEEN